MKQEEAEHYLSKSVKIILSNNFHFSGRVVAVDSESLRIIDKFNYNVSIKLQDIMLLTEVGDNGN